MARSPDTIAALATPAGASALAIIRVTGNEAEQLAQALGGQAPLPRRAHRSDYRDLAGVLVDDVLLTFFPEPNSATGEHVLEISCHGNPFIAQRILEDLFARGCRPAEPGEFTRRAFLNGRMDLSQAEAVMDLISARSERALAAAHRQLRGALGRRLQELTDELLGAIAAVEAYIDFPDEDLPPEDRGVVARSLAAVRQGSARLLATRHYGDLLRDGIKTVIVGEPNAGKSSLLNRLVGRDRAIVSPEPGTTRDFIEERVIAGAHCLRLIDTAGLNPAPGAIERLGMDQTRDRIEESDILLLVLDATRPIPGLVGEFAGRFRPENTLVVINKADLRPGMPAVTPLPGLTAVVVSALTGSGIEELTAAIGTLADNFQPVQGADAVVINARHAHALVQADECLGQAIAKLESGAPAELLASDLRGALAALGEIAGKIDHERMLDRLFANFCIGK